jgi:hypothetical protein
VEGAVDVEELWVVGLVGVGGGEIGETGGL